MTHPGDPGYAAARREATTRGPDASAEPVDGAGASGRRRPWTLRRRLLVIVASLLVAVSAVVGVVSVAVFHSSSVARLDANLDSAISRANVAIAGQPPGFPGNPDEAPSLVLNVPGQEAGTLAALVPDDGEPRAGYITEEGRVLDLPQHLAQKLAAVPADGEPHSIKVGDLGDYRALAVQEAEWDRVSIVLALPLAEVDAATSQLAITISIVALAGLAVALGLGSLIVTRALSPLARVTATAQRVSELPLDRGDVALAERVDVDDDGTEVGRLGSAFNRMLGHVASALTAREQSEQKVRRFVADASHELRTPLASIRGYAELTRLHGGELPEDVVHALSRIESESVRMTELVEDLLLLARLDEGRELVHSEVDLRALVVDAVGDAQAAGPDHEWSVDAAESPVVVSGDDARLRQVLANLLANARLHTPAGTAVTARLTKADGRARLDIVDDGPGIDEGLRDRLFERFARGDASRSRRAGSTGLGLAIVRAVVEAQHGTVSVESKPGRTVFTVELPLAAASVG
ncbi:HAMP domain-containing histidine kinase [Agromyces endophyticus]|uniref:sensor histidine kinase n=1 Tax=Agromyces sp. H17E-10 TaxID=2932244 RepID=UPI001FCF9315|nr:HAMP domain-containing sensor histidine kinase [Agromyces sp. H17E-10]UOQ90352.1 HAMP domain-containing histidine kinase [Agromyces sp. H17E-10]